MRGEGPPGGANKCEFSRLRARVRRAREAGGRKEEKKGTERKGKERKGKERKWGGSDITLL